MITQRIASLMGGLAAVLLFVSGVTADTFTSSNLDGANSWSTVYGQGFLPSVDSDPDLGLASSAPIQLDSFTFYRSGTADSAANIQLAILDGFYYDFNTTLTTGTAALLGLSSNTIASTAGLAVGDAYTFTFDDVSLTYGDEPFPGYGAIFVTDDGSGNLTPVLVSALVEDYVETPEGSGTFLPASNYGAGDNFDLATSNFISGGFFSAFGDAADARFTASFSSVPEPGSAGLLGMLVAIAGVGFRRRK